MMPREANNCSKMALQAAKLAYAIKTRGSIISEN